MRKRRLGKSGLEVAAIDLGCNDRREIDVAVSKIEVKGARYPEHLQKRVER